MNIDEQKQVIVTDIDDVWCLYDVNGMCVDTEVFEDYDAAEQWALDSGYEVID